MDLALKAIAEPHRREILHLVQYEELAAGEIAAHFNLTRPAISQHIQVLKAAQLLDERRNGTKRLYRARPEGLAELRDFVGEFWEDRLRRLRRVVEQEEKRRKDHDDDES